MANPETTLTEVEKAMQWERMSGERLSDAQRQHVQNGGKFLPPGSETQEECWVISVCLDDVDGVAADAWMDAIEAAVYARDPGFSGTVTMRKEIVDVYQP